MRRATKTTQPVVHDSRGAEGVQAGRPVLETNIPHLESAWSGTNKAPTKAQCRYPFLFGISRVRRATEWRCWAGTCGMARGSLEGSLLTARGKFVVRQEANARWLGMASVRALESSMPIWVPTQIGRFQHHGSSVRGI